MAGAKLSPTAKRWQTIMVTIPIIGATSFVLYKRLVLGEPQRTLPRPDSEEAKKPIVPLKPDSEGTY
ncbi:hypothetical protein C8Q75DRAFT_770152 [Abortiporus biennis]|nr:hypothetical protein C8Q75DRAFT_770152 [Abortiporus biennis]